MTWQEEEVQRIWERLQDAADNGTLNQLAFVDAMVKVSRLLGNGEEASGMEAFASFGYPEWFEIGLEAIAAQVPSSLD